jgi:hypothetical protein
MDMLQFRRLHLGALVVVLVVVTVTVLVRGVTAQGLSLIGMIAVIVAFRWWQLRRAQRPPDAS